VDLVCVSVCNCIMDKTNSENSILITSNKGGGKCVSPHSFVSLSVSKITQKRVHGLCCMVTDVGTWTNWLTFEPMQIIVQMLEPDCFLWYRMCHNADFIMSGKSHICILAWPVAAARHGFKMVLFTASRWNTFVGGTCTLPSAFYLSVF